MLRTANPNLLRQENGDFTGMQNKRRRTSLDKITETGPTNRASTLRIGPKRVASCPGRVGRKESGDLPSPRVVTRVGLPTGERQRSRRPRDRLRRSNVVCPGKSRAGARARGASLRGMIAPMKDVCETCAIEMFWRRRRRAVRKT